MRALPVGLLPRILLPSASVSNPDSSPASDSIVISVVVPVRNEADSIRQLIEALLSQTRPPAEIVITDGGSTDGTREIIGELIREGAPVRLVIDEDSLPGRSRNLAIANARNDWIAFIDAGIRPAPNWLEALAEKPRPNSIDVVYGTYEPIIDSFFKECAAIVYVSPETMTDEGPVRPYSIASALMHRSVWETVGGFPEDLRSAEDLLFMNKVTSGGFHIVRAPRAIVYWNIQPGFWRTFRRFVIYSRNNIRAGLFGDWQGRIFIYYAIIAASAVNYLWFGPRALIVPPLLWLLLLIARGVKSLRRNRAGYPASFARNLTRLFLVIPIIAVLDAATFVGSISWLLRDKLGLSGGRA